MEQTLESSTTNESRDPIELQGTKNLSHLSRL